ncbi:MAG: hypothetical protein ABW221_21230 [Vicinamibacteria bacterium]
MSGGPAEVPEIGAPSWLGQEFPAKGKISEKLADVASTLGDWSAKAADFAQAFELLGFLNLDAIGVAGTTVNQFRESTVKNPVLRAIEAGIAGAIDLAMGMTPLGPVLPAIDSAISMATGVAPGDLINNGLRAGFTAAEGAVTGDRQGTETLQARALVGEYGKVMKGILGG